MVTKGQGLSDVFGNEQGGHYTEIKSDGEIQLHGNARAEKILFVDISKMKKLGWEPRYSSDEAVRIATRRLLGK